jgi:hypothetical protein
MPNALTLPGGARLPAGFTEDDAVRLVHDLAHHYGWVYLLYDRADIEDRLDRTGRKLSDDEWRRVTGTAAWKTLPTVATNAIAGTGALSDVIGQAALECAECGTTLTGPPTATWGLCPSCLNGADLDELRNRACPAAGDDTTPHHWHNGACTHCTMPEAPRRSLTVVAPAA